MNNEELQTLRGKYYEGDTSLEEERALLEHFNATTTEQIVDSTHIQYLYFKRKKADGPSTKLTTRLDQLILANPQPTRRTLHIILRIAAAVFITFGLGWLFLTRYSDVSVNTIKTNAGQQLSATLPDGSLAWLNEKSELIYDQTFNIESRSISLRGEAYIEVQKNPSKPFIVNTGKVNTEVLGTSFNLRNYDDEQVIELDVIHGKVKFGDDRHVEVKEGESAYFILSEKKLKTSVRNPNADAWKTRRLVFEDVLMKDVLRDLGRYFDVRFEVEIPSLLNCHFRGHFFNPELEDVLSVIGYSLDVRYMANNGTYILSGQGCKVE